jgi:hypothetical protein
MPSRLPIACNDKSASNVIVFSMPHLLCLLHNPSIMIQESLVLDVKCPFKPCFASPGGVLSTSVYTEAYTQYVTQPNQLLVPIIQWRIPCPQHGTGNGRLSMDHGFLPKPVKLSSAQNKGQQQGTDVLICLRL